jgi:hypothetical protein
MMSLNPVIMGYRSSSQQKPGQACKVGRAYGEVALPDEKEGPIEDAKLLCWRLQLAGRRGNLVDVGCHLLGRNGRGDGSEAGDDKGSDAHFG